MPHGGPEVKKVAASLAGRALVLKVDTESSSRTRRPLQRARHPNFIVLRNGRLVFQHAGLAFAQEMQGWLSVC